MMMRAGSADPCTGPNATIAAIPNKHRDKEPFTSIAPIRNNFSIQFTPRDCGLPLERAHIPQEDAEAPTLSYEIL
jgi:hypothetical protein